MFAVSLRRIASWTVAVAAVAMLATTSLLAQEAETDAERDAERGTHKDRIIEINQDEGTIIVEGGGERHTHKITDRTQINVGNGKKGIGDLNPGDVVYVTIDEEDREAAIQIEVVDPAVDGEVEGEPASETAPVADEARESADSDRAAQEIARPRVVIGIRAVEPEGRAGALVVAVAPGGPADSAGIREGDVIVSIGGQQITDPGDLIQQLAQFAPEDTVRLEIVHGEETREAEVRLAAIEEVLGGEAQGGDPQPFIGIALEPVEGGLAVREILPGSPAAQADLRAGDVIVAVDEQAVESPETLSGRVQEAGIGNAITLRIRRGDEEITVDVTVGDRSQIDGAQRQQEERQPGATRLEAQPGGDDGGIELEFRAGGEREARLERMIEELRDEVERLREDVRALQRQNAGDGGEAATDENE